MVIVIIGVLGGMALPQLAGAWGSASLRASARDLLLAARYAHDYAVTRRVRCRLVLLPAEARYRIDAEAVDEQGAQAGFAPLTTPQGRARKLGDNVRIEPHSIDNDSDPSQLQITFEPTGEATAAVIGLTDAPLGRTHWTLRIAPSTGRAELLEGRAVQWIDDREDLDR